MGDGALRAYGPDLKQYLRQQMCQNPALVEIKCQSIMYYSDTDADDLPHRIEQFFCRDVEPVWGWMTKVLFRPVGVRYYGVPTLESQP